MRARGLLVAALVLPAVSLSGCVDCPRGPPVTARDVGAGTDSEAGLTGFSLGVLVTDEPGGPPIPGAGVVVYWARDNAEDWRARDPVVVESDGQGVRLIADPGASPLTPEARSTHRLRTDADGRALARVPGNRIVGVVAAAPGFTEEWIPALATGDGSGGDEITLPLYRANLSAVVEERWERGAASSGFLTRNNYEWRPSEVPFGDGAEARRGYVARLSELRLRLEWSNGLHGGGDLGIGLGAERDQPSVFEDSRDEVTPGEHAEELLLDAPRLRESGILGAPTAHAGPATDSGFLAPGGLPFRLSIEARFDTAVAALATCLADPRGSGNGNPGASVPLGTLAPFAGLALAAILTRRKA